MIMVPKLHVSNYINKITALVLSKFCLVMTNIKESTTLSPPPESIIFNTFMTSKGNISKMNAVSNMGQNNQN